MEEPKSPDDFMVCKLLGEDEDSTVVLARDASNNNEYAIKILEKSRLENPEKAKQVEQEKKVFKLLKHPLFVKLHYEFEDAKRIYFVLSYASNGDLQTLINASGGIGLVATQFYAAELVLALEYMASLNILHRDLKPENIMISKERHLQISDFGFVSILEDKSERVESFVGSPGHVPPELLSEKYSCQNSDLWSLGVVTYQMLTGKEPFTGSSEIETFTKIVNRDLKFSQTFDPNAKRLLESLLVLNPSERLGSLSSGGFQKLKEDPFFIGIDWETILIRPPPELHATKPYHLSYRHTSSSSSMADMEERLSPSKGGTMLRTKSLKTDPTAKQKLVESEPDDVEGYGLSPDIHEEQKKQWMAKQATSTWHRFADDKLILKCSELDKKRGFSVKTRQFILLEGPRLIYVDISTMDIKGEIPWSRELTAEVKTFKVFHINVPGRTYHIIDKKGNAMKWARKINEVKHFYFGYH